MKSKEIRNMDDEQLVEKVVEFREELFNLRFRNSTGELENTARMGEARRSLARTLTLVRERGIDLQAELRKSSPRR
jgi:large subunit ribosomal protein L29